MSYDSDVVSATSGVGEADWDKIIKLCNRIRGSVGPTSMHQAMQSVLKRVRHSNPTVQLHALTLLEACVSNCGQDFQKELTTAPFQNEVKSLLLGPHTDPRVTHKLKELLVNWSAEFKSAPHMKELLKFMDQLRNAGIHFSGPTAVPTSTQSTSSQGQGTRAKEEEDLRKAIQLSLQDKSSTPSSSSSSSATASSSAARPAKKEAKKVRAIYDFQAAEDNELSFRAGEIITLLDDSDENWWRGETQLSQGLFPASFVSRNLNKDPEPSKQEKKSKKKGKSTGGVANVQSGRARGTAGGVGGVNEQKVDLLLDMLKSADVTDTSQEESKTVKQLETEVLAMRPVVEQTIQQLTAHEDVMQSVSTKFNEALAHYRKLLAEGPRLSDMPQPPVVQSHAHTVQHGMTTHETHAVNHAPPQPGMGTQPFYQNGVGTQPHQNGMQLPPVQSGFQPPVQHGMGMPMQHGTTPVQQPGIGSQPTLSHGMGVPQTGMAIPPQNGVGTQPLYSVYSTSPGRYVPNEMLSGEVSLQPAPSLQYHPQQPLTMIQPSQQSSYAPPSYQQPVVPMTTHLSMAPSQPPPSLAPSHAPPSLSATFLPPPYHTAPPPQQTTQMLPQPLL